MNDVCKAGLRATNILSLTLKLTKLLNVPFLDATSKQ